MLCHYSLHTILLSFTPPAVLPTAVPSLIEIRLAMHVHPKIGCNTGHAATMALLLFQIDLRSNLWALNFMREHAPRAPLFCMFYACLNIHICVTPLLKILATGVHCAVDAQKHAQEHVKLLIYLFKYKSAMVSEDSSLYQRVKNFKILMSWLARHYKQHYIWILFSTILSSEFWSWKFWSPGHKFLLKNMVRRLKNWSESKTRVLGLPSQYYMTANQGGVCPGFSNMLGIYLNEIRLLHWQVKSAALSFELKQTISYCTS